MIKSLAFVAATLAALAISSAEASTMAFDDRDAFLEAGGEATFYKLGDDLTGVDPITGAFDGPAAIGALGSTIGFVSDSMTASSFPQGRDGGVGIVPAGLDDFWFLLAEPAFGFGFDLVKDRFISGCDDFTGTCPGTVLTLSLFDNGQPVGSELFALPETDVFDAFFLGVQSTMAFDSVRVAETNAIAGTEFNNEAIYLNFVSTAAPIQPVPLPAPLFLLLAGIGALGLMRVRSCVG